MNKELIKQKLNEFSEQKQLSKNKLAEKIGVSPATLSNIENNHWERVNNEMFLKVWNAIKSREFEIVETTNFSKILGLCDYARFNNKMIGIIGFTGAGKTTALKEYYKSNKNTYYISCKKTMSAKQLLLQILREMGVSFNGTIYHIVERIASELNKQASPLLIIDEAGKLSQRVMEYLHDLRNDTETNGSIVLAGVEYFKNNLKKAVDRNKEGMPEFYDRISSWHQLELPKKHEIRAICNAHGVDNQKAINQIFRVGNFRKLANFIENVQQSKTVSHA